MKLLTFVILTFALSGCSAVSYSIVTCPGMKAFKVRRSLFQILNVETGKEIKNIPNNCLEEDGTK